jgi:hypothetical protein
MDDSDLLKAIAFALDSAIEKQIIKLRLLYDIKLNEYNSTA